MKVARCEEYKEWYRKRERETKTMKNREETELKRRKVSDPHGNRIKTLDKRNFSSGKGGAQKRVEGEVSLVRLIRRVWKSAKEIRERRTSSWRFPLRLAYDNVPCFSIH